MIGLSHLVMNSLHFIEFVMLRPIDVPIWLDHLPPQLVYSLLNFIVLVRYLSVLEEWLLTRQLLQLVVPDNLGCTKSLADDLVSGLHLIQ